MLNNFRKENVIVLPMHGVGAAHNIYRKTKARVNYNRKVSVQDVIYLYFLFFLKKIIDIQSNCMGTKLEKYDNQSC